MRIAHIKICRNSATSVVRRTFIILNTHQIIVKLKIECVKLIFTLNIIFLSTSSIIKISYLQNHSLHLSYYRCKSQTYKFKHLALILSQILKVLNFNSDTMGWYASHTHTPSKLKGNSYRGFSFASQFFHSSPGRAFLCRADSSQITT